MSTVIQTGYLKVEIPSGGHVGRVLGRLDLHVREPIRVHVGRGYAQLGGLCGRFTAGARLVYYCRMTEEELDRIRDEYGRNMVSHYAQFDSEHRMSQDIMVRTSLAIRKPTFEELGGALAHLLLTSLQLKPATVDFPLPKKQWSLDRMSVGPQRREAFIVSCVFHRDIQKNHDRHIGRQYWDVTNCGALEDPWRIPCPELWSPSEWQPRYEAEEILAEALQPLVMNLRGDAVLTPEGEHWIQQADARLAVRMALAGGSPTLSSFDDVHEEALDESGIDS